MRENLLKKQPTWGLRRAQGTGQKSATPATLTKVILVLLTMFLLPSAAWAQTITVAGVSPDADGNFTGLSGVTFSASTSTLTLNNATITGQISSTYDVLKVHLLGESTITPGDGYAAFFYSGTGTGTLTFDTEWVSDEYGMYFLGSLIINGVTKTQGSVTSGYTISNTFEDDFPSYIDPYNADNKTTGWKKTYDDDYTKIWKFEVFDLWIGSGRVISTQLEAGQSGGPKFDPVHNTLPIKESCSYPIKSKMAELVITVCGEYSISPDYDTPTISYIGADTDGELTFVVDENTSLASLILTKQGSGTSKAIEGFTKSNIHITNPLRLVSPASMDDILNATSVTISNYTQTYDITVAGVQVTDQNAEDILGNNTVSYDAENHKLTLNNANLTSLIHWGINADLTIELKGTNSMNTSGACIDSEYDEIEIIFTGGDENCSLELSTVTDDYFFSGFSNTDNPSMGTGMYWILTWNNDHSQITSALITNSLLGGGKGTEGEPFIISTFDELKTFAKYVNDGILSTEYIKLGGNIDCTNLTGFEPIGNSNSFIGTFNGDGNSITGLIFSNTNPDGVAGLFGNIGEFNNGEITRGTVKNLTLSGCQFENGARNGAIAGNLAYGTIENCTVTSCTISSGNSQSTFSGGITGIIEGNGIVKDCSVNGGTITSSTSDTSDGEVCAGGIVAEASGSSEINGCTVTDVSINSICNRGHNSYSGGIVGSSQATISGNSVEGTTTVNSINNENNETYAGAIVAKKAGGSLTNNYYYYTVNTQTKIGDNEPVEKSEYTERGIGDEDDIFENNGAVLYTKPVVLPTESSAGAVTGEEGTYYIKNDGSILVAPGQKAKINATPSTEEHYALLWLKAVNASTVITTDSTDIANGGRQYSFDMPDAQVDVTAKFAIDLAAEGITATIANATCTGEALEPTTIAVEGITDVTSLTKDTDFTITGYTKGGEAVTSPIDVGTYTVSIKGKGDYTGTKDVSYTIEKGIAGLYFYHIKGDQEDPVLAVEEATYGTAYDSPRLKNPHNLPITFSCKAENSETGAESDVATIDDEGNVTILKSGTVYVYAVAAENDNYKELDKHYQLNIYKANLNKVTIANIADQTYTGSAITPELTVTTPDGTSVTTDDYGIGYTPDNTNVGKVTITLTAKEGSEKFTGSTTTTFNIIPPTPTIAFDNTKTYLNTDKIAISIDEAYATSSATAGITNTIYYSWDKNPVTGTEYSEGDVAAQTGTLTAWVSATKSGATYESEKTTKAFTVKTDISDYTVQGLATSATYTGAAIVPAFSVKASADAETSLTLNTDYTVSYQSVIIAAGDVGSGPSINYTDVDEMVEVGAYRIVITGTGDSYGGTKYADFAITKADLDIVTIESIADQTYTGSAITLEGVTVTLNGNTISPDEYEITGYTNNTNVTTETQKATVTIAATATSEHFTENTTKTAEFNIIPKELTEEMVTVSTDPLIYNGEDQTPNVTVTIKDGETTLEEGEDKDYTISYKIDDQIAEETVDAGTYTIVITGQGNYTGEVNTKTFTIAAMDASAATITLEADKTYTYNGSDQTPAVVSVELDGGTIPDTNYDISYSNNKNAGLATAGENAPTVIVTFKNNYSGEVTTTFTIEQADLSDYVVTGLTTPTAYTGSPITPTFSVKATETAETSLTANTDYSVKYQQAGADVDEMKDAGDYKIIITGEGNYKGSLDADFTIDRAQLNLTINLEGWAYGDTPNEPSLEGNLGEGVITWEYKAAGAEAYSAWSTLTTTTDAGTYMVKATVAETDNYEGGSKEAEFVIEQLDISQADITLDNNELTYNGEQQTVNVTKVMAGNIEVPIDCYKVSGNTEKEAGDYKLTVTAKTMDSSGNPIKNNFKGSAEKAWKINHRTASAEELGFKSETQTASTYYNSDEDFNLPEGYVAYIITGINGNSVTTQRVSYIPKDVAVLVEKGQSSESPNDATPYPSTLPLKGTQEPVDVTSITGGTVYVLYNGEFVKSTSGTIPAHRCYLLIPDQIASGTRSFGINHGDGTTSLREVKGEKWADGEWYTLQGRKFTTKPTKPGLYILNGKKVVIK